MRQDQTQPTASGDPRRACPRRARTPGARVRNDEGAQLRGRRTTGEPPSEVGSRIGPGTTRRPLRDPAKGPPAWGRAAGSEGEAGRRSATAPAHRRPAFGPARLRTSGGPSARCSRTPGESMPTSGRPGSSGTASFACPPTAAFRRGGSPGSSSEWRDSNPRPSPSRTGPGRDRHPASGCACRSGRWYELVQRASERRWEKLLSHFPPTFLPHPLSASASAAASWSSCRSSRRPSHARRKKPTPGLVSRRLLPAERCPAGRGSDRFQLVTAH